MTTYSATVGGKWIFDGSKTVKDMIKRLDDLKKQLQKYEKAGLRLEGPVEDDYACLTTTDEAVAKRLRLVLHSEDTDDE